MKTFDQYTEEERNAILMFFKKRRTFQEACAFFNTGKKEARDIMDALMDDHTITGIIETHSDIHGYYFYVLKYTLNTEAE